MAYSLGVYYYLSPLSQPSKYLNRLGNGAPSDNQDVTVYAPLGSPDQKWKVELAGDGGMMLNALNDSYGLTGSARFALNIWRGATKYNKCDIVKLKNNTAKDYVVNLETHDGGQNIYRICIMGYGLYMTARSDGSVYWEAKKGTGTSSDQLWKLSTSQSGGGGNTLSLPVESYSYISRGYTAPGHLGVDYVNVGGTKLLAAATGKVIYTQTYNENKPSLPSNSFLTMGNCIYIQHPNLGMTLYMHMNAPPTLKVGDSVTRGQVVGYMGDSGNASGIHLHFGFKTGSTFRYNDVYAYDDGTWVNPENYIK